MCVILFYLEGGGVVSLFVNRAFPHVYFNFVFQANLYARVFFFSNGCVRTFILFFVAAPWHVLVKVTYILETMIHRDTEM